MSYIKLLKPTITYIQAKHKFLKQASTDKSNMSIYKQVRAHKKQIRAHKII